VVGTAFAVLIFVPLVALTSVERKRTPAVVIPLVDA
jgi:hypothetical protein